MRSWCRVQCREQLKLVTEGQGVVVFMYQPLKLHQLSSPVQQVFPRQQSEKPGVETSQV